MGRGDIRAYRWFSLIAGRRGGKTRIGSLAAILEATQPDSFGLVTGPTYDDLHSFIWPHIFSQIPKGWVKDWSEKHMELFLNNGAMMKGLSLDDPEAARGYGADWLWMDEPAKISEKAWQVARPTLADKHGIAWFTGTPSGFNWVYDKLWRPALEGVPGYWATKYFTRENPIFQTSEGKLELADMQASMSAEMYKQEMEAEFTDFLGAIYGLLVEKNLLRTDAEIRTYLPEWPTIRPDRPVLVGIDPGAGIEHPTAALIAVRTERAIIGIGEYRETTKPIVYHAAQIQRLLNKWNFLDVSFVIDKQRKQEQIEFAQHGIYAAQVEGGPGSLTAGIDRVRAWMERGQFKLIPKLVPKTIEEMNTYRWADPVLGDGQLKRQLPYKLKDDLCDCARYIMMHWPTLMRPSDEWGFKALGEFPENQRMQIYEDRIARGVVERPENQVLIAEEHSEHDVEWHGGIGNFFD